MTGNADFVRATGSTMAIRANGLLFRARIDGTDGAPWVLLGNSLMTDLSLWDEQVVALAPFFRILRYDQRGHGGTEAPPEACTFDQLADDAVALLDALAVERAAYAGISLGGITGLALASRHPDRISRLALSDCGWVTQPGAAEQWKQRIETALTAGMAQLVEPTVGRWFSPDCLARKPAAVDRVRATIAETSVAGFVACARALQQFYFRREFSRIRHAMLLLVGSRDGALPSVMRQMQESTADAELVEITGAGHLPNIEDPGAFNHALGQFLLAGGR